MILPHGKGNHHYNSRPSAMGISASKCRQMLPILQLTSLSEGIQIGLTLPTAKAGGILGSTIATFTPEEVEGITQSPQACKFGRVPPYCGIIYQADKPIYRIPSSRMFCAALMSRSWEAPQTGHTQYRTLRSLTAEFFVPQQ